MMRVWAIALTYVGALVGAGFASGQELVKFFVAFGFQGIWGVILSGCIFAFGGIFIVRISQYLGVVSYDQLFERIFSPAISKGLKIIISLTLWMGLGIMLMGSSTLFQERFNCPKLAGFSLTMILVYIALSRGQELFLKVNSLLVPLLIILAVINSVIYIAVPTANITVFAVEKLLPNWWTASILYGAYNMLLGLVVLVNLSSFREARKGAFLGGMILTLLALAMVWSLSLAPEVILSTEMPMLALAQRISIYWSYIYGIALWIAMFTTALANCYALVENFAQGGRNIKQLLFLILVTTFIFIPFDFSFLVGTIYPLMGYLSIPILLVMFWQWKKIKENS